MIAPLRAARNARTVSTIPWRGLAGAVAVPASTPRAAASASIGKLLWFVKSLGRLWCGEDLVNLSSDVALQAPHDF